MAKEQFFYPETQPLFKKLEQLSQRSSVSRAQAFEDWLTATVCALAAETKEDEYLAMVERHKEGQTGKRGIDLMPPMFGELVNSMTTRSDADILGDLFQAAITYGESGQYFSPQPIAELLAKLSIDPDAKPQPEQPLLVVNDCCCGTGRMLLAAADINPEIECVGQDVDARCAKITAVNLGLRARYGWVVCGNSLTGDSRFAYRIGSFFHESPNGLRRGVIRDVPVEEMPIPLIASRMKSEVTDLFEKAERAQAERQPSLPTIIEVPRWLARLEPALAALDREEPPVIDERSEPVSTKTEHPPAKQQELF